MRAVLESVVARLFPGMGLRPLWMTMLATWAMVLYHHHGGGSEAPSWFIDRTRSIFDVDDLVFHQHLWSHATAVVLLMIVPLLAGWAFEGWTPRDLGFRIRDAGPETLVVLGLWAVMIPVVWLVHDTASFAATYPRLEAARNSMELYFLYEGAVGLGHLFAHACGQPVLPHQPPHRGVAFDTTEDLIVSGSHRACARWRC